MNIIKVYVVYELNRVMGSENHLALQRVEFNGVVSNRFDTEDDAIQALIKDDKFYENYIIVREVYIQNW
jgi:hypothetical protein